MLITMHESMKLNKICVYFKDFVSSGGDGFINSKVKLEWGHNVIYLLIRKVVCLYYFVYLLCFLDFLMLHLFPIIGNQAHLALNLYLAFFFFPLSKEFVHQALNILAAKSH
jgi:hypothetical protein